jgi:hypothetical protein
LSSLDGRDSADLFVEVSRVAKHLRSQQLTRKA